MWALVKCLFGVLIDVSTYKLLSTKGYILSGVDILVNLEEGGNQTDPAGNL